MRIFSYRNKRALRRALLIALLAVVVIFLLMSYTPVGWRIDAAGTNEPICAITAMVAT